jgi:hypothetical protein
MKQVIPFAQEQDITVIIPAGNDAPTGLHENTPQILGTADNGLITVGGVEMDGSLFTLTNPDLGMGGSISIYAPAPTAIPRPGWFLGHLWPRPRSREWQPTSSLCRSSIQTGQPVWSHGR